MKKETVLRELKKKENSIQYELLQYVLLVNYIEQITTDKEVFSAINKFKERGKNL